MEREKIQEQIINQARTMADDTSYPIPHLIKLRELQPDIYLVKRPGLLSEEDEAFIKQRREKARQSPLLDDDVFNQMVSTTLDEARTGSSAHQAIRAIVRERNRQVREDRDEKFLDSLQAAVKNSDLSTGQAFDRAADTVEKTAPSHRAWYHGIRIIGRKHSQQYHRQKLETSEDAHSEDLTNKTGRLTRLLKSD